MAEQYTHRERFRRVMHYQSVDRLPHWEFGYWDETIDRWHDEGLPKHLKTNPEVEAYFGVDPRTGPPFNHGLNPPFETKVLEERDGTIIMQMSDGSIAQQVKSGIRTIPHYIDFPVRDRATWEDYKRRLRIDDPVRQFDYEKLAPELNASTLPVAATIGSFFGVPRNMIGFERISLMVYDDRPLVQEIIDHLTEMTMSQLSKALAAGIRFDFAGGWEDICYKSGPIISPKMFDELCGPGIERVCSALRKHGCDVIWTDCDGDVTPLVPVWLKRGLNCMFPVEVHAGSDPVEMRRRWGKDLLLVGGFDKFAFDSKEKISAELKRIAPLVEEGAFIPHVDHRVPANVSYENYKFYIREKLKLIGFTASQIQNIEPLA